MPKYLCPSFYGMSEFGAGHNDCCGPCAEEVALASLEGRKPTATHMDTIRTRDIAEGWFHPKTGENGNAIYEDLVNYEHGSGVVVPTGTSASSMIGVAIEALKQSYPIVANLHNAEKLPHNEPGVFGHFVTLGGYNSDNDTVLVANGDYWTGKGVIPSGATPTYWVGWNDLIASGWDSMVIFKTTGNQKIQTAWGPGSATALWPWLPQDLVKDPNITHWNGKTELGIDIGMPTGTEITSLTYGKVVNSFYFGGGGVVVVQSTFSDIGVGTVYYQHLDVNVAAIGDTVRLGDIIGYSGGQLKGGHHPVTCCSTGPHIEVGRNGGSANSQWKGMGPNTDPLPWLQNLVLKGPPVADIEQSNLGATKNGGSALLAATNNTVTGQGPVADSFAAIATAIDHSMQFVAVVDINNLGDVIQALINPSSTTANIGHDIGAFIMRGIVVSIGFFIILAFIFHLLQPVAKVATEVAATGALVAS